MKEWIFYSVQYTSYQRIWIDISVQCVYGNCSLGVIRYHFGWHSLPHLGLNSHHEVTKSSFPLITQIQYIYIQFWEGQAPKPKTVGLPLLPGLAKNFPQFDEKIQLFWEKKIDNLSIVMHYFGTIHCFDMVHWYAIFTMLWHYAWLCHFTSAIYDAFFCHSTL